MSHPRQVLPGRVYLVTRRCTQRQFLLRPDRETTNAFLYCLGYAVSKTGLEVVAFIANSNHHHTVVTDVDGRLPEFLHLFHLLLGKHQNALRGRSENMWSSEPTSVVELVGPEDIIAKVVYTLSNPAKDHLVKHAREWPGATSLRATLQNEVMRATKPNRHFARNGSMPPTIELRCKMPEVCRGAMSQDEFVLSIERGIEEAEQVAERERARTKQKVLGVAAILSQSPFERPKSRKPRRELDPRIAARDKGARIEAIERMKAFRDAYAAARQLWKEGKPVAFPPGTWWLRRHAGGVTVVHPD